MKPLFIKDEPTHQMLSCLAPKYNLDSCYYINIELSEEGL